MARRRQSHRGIPWNASDVFVCLTQHTTMRQVTMNFIRWRIAGGYQVTPFRRQFCGKKKTWRANWRFDVDPAETGVEAHRIRWPSPPG